jgi:peroxiredoxin
VIGISYDSEEVLRRAVAQQKISFLLLSDSGSKTIDAYGVRNKEAGNRIDGVPHPVTIVVDSKGIVRAKLGHEGYRDRHPSEELIGVLKKIQ